MRITAELLSLAEQRPNPLGERELVLRGLAIPAIENLGATQNAYDTVDLTDNRLSRLDNFSKMHRLSSLACDDNAIESIDVANLKKNVPNIKHLSLSNNRITALHHVSGLGDAFAKLEFLNLVGNPVTRRQHYRLYAIQHIPSLKVLDFSKIKKSERERATRLAKSAAGAALESDVQAEARNDTTKTFVPGEGESAEESFATSFTPEQKEMIRQMVAEAQSPAEIEAIERSVQRGILPSTAKRKLEEAAANGVTEAKKIRLEE